MFVGSNEVISATIKGFITVPLLRLSSPPTLVGRRTVGPGRELIEATHVVCSSNDDECSANVARETISHQSAV